VIGPPLVIVIADLVPAKTVIEGFAGLVLPRLGRVSMLTWWLGVVISMSSMVSTTFSLMPVIFRKYGFLTD
jgi:hypothetical protein